MERLFSCENQLSLIPLLTLMKYKQVNFLQLQRLVHDHDLLPPHDLHVLHILQV